MREIKFRGKDKENKNWVYGDLVHRNEQRYITVGNVDYYDTQGDKVLLEHAKWCEVISETVGQYTGLNDTNGKRIYEGDILQAHDYPKDRLTFFVKWYVYGGFNLLGINTQAFNVVGNIHDNPKLMEGEG